MRLYLLRKIAFSSLLYVSLVGCGGGNSENDTLFTELPERIEESIETNSLGLFQSQEAFMQTLESYVHNENIQNSATFGSGYNDAPEAIAASESVDTSVEDTSSGSTNTNITNNQESSVDEGGIVKNIDDFLVTLRHGKLFVTNIKDELKQTNSMLVAPTKNLQANVWYDEMLVKGNIIIVTAYRYSVPGIGGGATEVSLFSLESNGKLKRGAVHFYESYDYFSGSNYSSRLVNGKLVMFTPVNFRHQYGKKLNYRDIMPSISKLSSEYKAVRKREVVSWEKMYIPLEIPKYYSLVMNVMHRCEINSIDAIDCDSSGVLDNMYGTRYVSSKNMYIYGDQKIYKWSLEDMSLSVHKIIGYPSDRFAFKEKGDVLNIAVNVDASQLREGDEALSEMQMLQINLSDFSNKVNVNSDVKSLLTPLNTRSFSKIRFNNETALIVENSDFYDYDTNFLSSKRESKAVFFDLGSKAVSTVSLSSMGSVNRIELLGSSRFLVSSSVSNGLKFTALDSKSNRELSSTVLSKTSEGESRSHGFFFKPSETGGYFGIAELSHSERYSYASSANVGYYEFNASKGEINPLGVAQSQSIDSNVCASSCVGWYGNTRPVFIGNDVYALMGYEIVKLDTRTNNWLALDRVTLK